MKILYCLQRHPQGKDLLPHFEDVNRVGYKDMYRQMVKNYPNQEMDFLRQRLQIESCKSGSAKLKKIVKRTAKLDASGKRVGERVVAIFPVNKDGIKWVSIMWTDQRIIYSINAPSLQLALEFERTPHDQLGNMLER
jgi:hypothetical protein